MSIPQSGGGPIERPEQMAEYIAAGCKPASEWRLGTEHEKFGFLTDTLTPLPYAGERSISALFAGLESRYGWTPVQEAGNTIGMKRARPTSALNRRAVRTLGRAARHDP